MQKLRPILGFGPVGWIASCVLLAIVIAALCGYDFQFHYIVGIDKLFGQRFLFWYLYEIHVWHAIMWKDPMFGLIAAGVAVIALFISPMRHGWWRYLIVIAWGLMQPRLSMYCGEHLWNAGIPNRLELGLSYFEWLVLTGFGLNVLACFMLWIVTDSRLVMSIGIGATVLVTAYVLLTYRGTISIYISLPASGPLETMLGPFWNLALGSALFWWAFRARQIVIPEGACQHCGYDLRGTSHPRCPECGQSNSLQIPATTPNFPTDSPGT